MAARHCFHKQMDRQLPRKLFEGSVKQCVIRIRNLWIGVYPYFWYFPRILGSRHSSFFYLTRRLGRTQLDGISSTTEAQALLLCEHARVSGFSPDWTCGTTSGTVVFGSHLVCRSRGSKSHRHLALRIEPHFKTRLYIARDGTAIRNEITYGRPFCRMKKVEPFE